MTFLWIDDESNREADCRNLGKALSVNAIFEDVNDKNLDDELKRIRKGTKPDLILIDHRLNKVKGKSYETGSTSAEVIREEWPDCPIVCITGVQPKDIESHKQSIYEELIEYPKLSDYYSTLESIATSYKELKSQFPINDDELLKLLKVPSDEKIRLKAILPEELKRINTKDKSLLMTISRWVRKNLMARPGFLYDGLWTATLLGIKESSFKKIRSQFDKAKYIGVFSDEHNERWWQSRVKEILYSTFPKENEHLTWILGRKLTKITKKDYSKCFACEEDCPEIVAYTDETYSRAEPMHLRCSVPASNFQSSLFFDEIRIMKPAR